jgi:hypothetical protein
MLLVATSLTLLPNLPPAQPVSISALVGLGLTESLDSRSLATLSPVAPLAPLVEPLAPPVAPLAPPVAPLAPLGGGSSPISYTYVEVNYVYTDLNHVPGTQNGVEAVVSWNLLLGLYLEGSYARGNGDTDVDRSRIGAGYHVPLGEKLDVFGFVNYEHEHLSSSGSSSSGDGYEFDLGARYMLFESLEVNGQGEWNHVHDDNFGVKFGGRYYFPGPLSVGATVESIDSDFRFTGGVRFQF